MSENFEKSKPEVSTVGNLPLEVQESADLVNSNRRRHLAKFAVGAPVLMTLASRPVLAGQCLSNMMSGNLSNPNRGQCSKGWSPGGWGQPGGQVHTYSTVGAWAAVGLFYGDCTSVNGGGNCTNYSGGSTLADVSSYLNQDSLPTTKLLRELLTTEPNQHQLTRHLVCAFLNARLGALSGSTFLYILKPQQVLDLASGAMALPPGYSTLQAFLGSTWTGV